MTTTQGENLIFLISQPRAGSTLLQLILSGHKDIATTSEPWIALHPVYALRDKGIRAEYDAILARKTLKGFLEQSGIDESYYKAQIASLLLALYKHPLERQGARYFLDKTPRYYNIIPELKELFPKARFIILFRNPLAVLNSILETWVKGDWIRLNTRYRNDLLVAPRKLIEGLRLLGDRCISIKYEDLVTNPESTIKRVCRFLGVAYSHGLLKYCNQISPEWRFGDRVGIHKDDYPNLESLNKWKKGFKSLQAKHIAVSYFHELGPSVIEGMGYNFEALKSGVTAPQKNDYLIPWSVLMRNSDNLLDKVELDLYLNPEHMADIENRYARVHQRGFRGLLFRGLAGIMSSLQKIASKLS